MEWNLRPSSLWEWENLFEFDASKAGENPKKLLQEVDRGISSGSPGGSSKSSVSASINSSSSNNNKFTLDGFDPNKQLGGSPKPEISAEPFLSLKLGKRMYFKDISAAKNPSPPSVVSSSAQVKRNKSGSPSSSSLAPRCQVEGCNLDLSTAKDYHRKHRICESHSKSPRVVVGGAELRFCQQCSRFHVLSEFDEKKRSCRRRLSDHNARRRKPQPESIRLNPARFTSIYDESPQKMSLVFDQTPRLFATTNFSWDQRQDHNGTSIDGSKPMKEYTGFAWDHNHKSSSGHTKEYLSRTVNGQRSPLLNNNVTTMLYPPHNNSTRLIPNKPEFLQPGIEGSSSAVNTSNDLQHALSLLSTSSWDSSRETNKPVIVLSNNHHCNNNNSVHNNHQIMNQGLVLAQQQQQQPLVAASSEFWHSEPNSIQTEPRSAPTAQFQDLHLFKPTNDSGFYPYHFN